MLANLDSDLEARLTSALTQLCSEFEATMGVVWIRDGFEQLLWGPSVGILANEFPSSSIFASDILLNVDETFEVGVCQAFPACDEGQFRTLSHPAAIAAPKSSVPDDDRIRELVCGHCQLLIPLFLREADVVFSLFVASEPGKTPSATIPQLDTVADRLTGELEPQKTIGLYMT
ncbi:MAG: hypothetical protein AB8B50_07390 [Pirellulaceae bacterium]